MADDTGETSLAVVSELWDQRPGEPQEAFLAFQKFLNLGYKRTLRKLYVADCKEAKRKPSGAIPPSYTRMAALWDWQKRALAYEEAQIAEDSRLKSLRRAEVREEEFGIARILIDKAKDMLKFPLQTVRIEGENGQTTIINPSEWKLTDAAVLVKTASELYRLSLDMSQGKMEIAAAAPANQNTPYSDMLWLRETIERGQEIPGVEFEVKDRTDDGDTNGQSQALPAGPATDNKPDIPIAPEGKTT